MSVSEKLKGIFDKNVNHKTFLDKDSVMSCMNESYILGKTESLSTFNKMNKVLVDLTEKCKSNSENEFCNSILELNKE